ncbi:GNAT family N-acetyltransferase [Paenibacillus caui]|uniref:GNAT family N-acetyltransferase n=1 Tax=Paenibacillus caui TaxID=2873927 RepID=UPI001CA91317|nr:GNAT family N-acetyltransferase [Paenibacillus caui]
MITLERIKTGQVRWEMQIMNSDPFFNRVTKGKESFALEEALQEIQESEELGAERYFILNGDERIGMLEFLMKNPADGCTWLGLLLIDKKYQRQGYGRFAFELFCSMMKDRKVSGFRIGVAIDNDPAHRFWENLDFKPIEHRKKPDGREIVIYELNI